MLRSCLFPFTVVSFLASCVPVTEPLSDASTSEAEMRLVGKWHSEAFVSMTIDVPAVKGNPKGIMRAVLITENVFWFYTTKIGKETYANTCDLGDSQVVKEGEFLDWGKRPYFIARLFFKGNKEVSCHNGSCLLLQEGYSSCCWFCSG
jgi:hypothetical protein